MGRGNRAKGLSQVDLALLIDVDPRHMGRLERGEAPMSEALAQTISEKLLLEPRERVELWRIVFQRDPGAISVERAGASLSPAWKRRLSRMRAEVIQEGQHKVVTPIVYATDLGWNMLALNDGAREMFGGEPPENTFYWIAEQGRDQLPSHEKLWLGLLLPQLRGLIHKYPDHPGLLELERWCEKTPSVAGAWSRSGMPSYVTPDGDIRPFIHPVYGKGSMEMGVLTPHRDEDRDLRVFMMDLHIGVSPREVERQRCTLA